MSIRRLYKINYFMLFTNRNTWESVRSP